MLQRSLGKLHFNANAAAFSTAEQEAPDVNKLLQENNSLKEELKKTKDEFLRSLAEQQNIVTRLKQEQEKNKDFAITNFAKEVVEVADNLQRALETINIETVKQSESVPSDQIIQLWEGIELTRKGLFKAFAKFEIEEYDPMGDKFNPNIHESLFTFEDPNQEHLTIGHVAQKGYFIKDRILRSAKVGYVVKS